MTTKTPKKKTAKKIVKKNLSPEQELFCQLYVGNHNRDLFGNATRCYMEAYGFNERIAEIRDEVVRVTETGGRGYTSELRHLEAKIKSIEGSAKTAGNRLLTIIHIRSRIDGLMDSMITEEFYDREMLYVAGQRFDLASKVAAMREFNALKKRITKDPPATVGPITIQISPDVLNKMGLA